jgi:hypothetical protein
MFEKIITFFSTNNSEFSCVSLIQADMERAVRDKLLLLLTTGSVLLVLLTKLTLEVSSSSVNGVVDQRD